MECEDCFIDLVFYNYLLKCFVLVDLKVGKLAHQAAIEHAGLERRLVAKKGLFS